MQLYAGLGSGVVNFPGSVVGTTGPLGDKERWSCMTVCSEWNSIPELGGDGHLILPTEKHPVVHFRRMNFRVGELFLIEAVN